LPVVALAAQAAVGLAAAPIDLQVDSTVDL